MTFLTVSSPSALLPAHQNQSEKMAKLKKRSKLSQQRHRANQLRNPNGDAKSTNKNESNKSIKVNSLLDKIKISSNCSINEKLIAINTILVQCNNDENIRKLFLKNDLVKLIIELLNQDNQFDEILVSCLDLIKHLIIEENYDLSIYLWRNGIWDILNNNFTKAFKSIEHVNDSNVNIISKDLLINYINNLISILDNLVMELNLDIIDNSLLPNLINSNLLSNLFNLLNEKSKFSIVLNILQFFYDLSSISINFLQNYLINNKEFEDKINNLIINDSLGKIYLIGIKLQILEIKDDLTNNLDLIINEIFQILNETNMNCENDKDFQIVDISLDLLTTIIEIKGSLLFDDNNKIDKFFNNQCINNILPFIGKLFENDNSNLNNKKLVCLNNLIIYLNSNNLITDNLLNDLTNLNENKINKDFNDLLSNNDDNDNDEKLEKLINFINFKLNILEINPSKFVNEENQINQLINLSLKLNKYESTNIELQIEFITCLLMYLSLLAKCIGNIETVRAIVEFIVKYNLIEPIEFYNNQLKNLNISKFHNKYNYLIEESINISINSIFEMFDDDYPYNKPIYHGDKLNDVLINILIDYKKIYKNIDKNLNSKLKKQTEETINNLQRFIEYKKTE